MYFLDQLLPVISGVSNLLFPVSCVICGAPDVELCTSCIATITPDWQRVDRQALYLTEPREVPLAKNYWSGAKSSQVVFLPIFPVYAANRYAGNVKELIIHWKHTNLVSFEQIMLQLWKAEILSLLQLLVMAGANFSLMFPKLNPNLELYVVNAPSKFRRRFDNQLIAWKLAEVLGACIGVEPLEALRKELHLNPALFTSLRQINIFAAQQNRKVADFAARRKKTHGVKVVRNLNRKQVLLVDDVFTTGATLLGCARAVRAVGGEVIGAICFANAAAELRKPMYLNS